MKIYLEKKKGGYCECGCKGSCDTDYFELSVDNKKIRVDDVSDIFDLLDEYKIIYKLELVVDHKN